MLSKKKQTQPIQAMQQSEYKSIGLKERAMKLLQNSRICPFKWEKNTFICMYCPELYTDPAELRKHNQIHEDIKMTQISRALGTKPELVKADITDVSCKLCDATIDCFDTLKIHLIKKHKHNSCLKSDDGILPFKLNQGSFKCGTCDEDFPEYMTLYRHFKNHFQTYICEQCGSGFVSHGALQSHYATHETGSYSCNECGKVFRSKRYMLAHENIVHSKAKTNRCPHCHETFMYYIQKLNHLSSVHGIKVKEFKCDICPSVFITKGWLNKHTRTHSNEKTHACVVCDARFGSKRTLKGHMLKHTVEKSHHCGVCQKSFKTKSTLVTHMRIHLNDKRFACNVCGVSFVQKCSLKQHGRTHHTNQSNAGQYN